MPPCGSDQGQRQMPADMAGMPGMPSSNDSSGRDIPSQPSCPLAVLGNGASCLVVALTASAGQSSPSTPETSSEIDPVETRMHSKLNVSAVFHPPKS